jgi:hypothetical protein
VVYVVQVELQKKKIAAQPEPLKNMLGYIWNLAIPDIEGFFDVKLEAFDIEGFFQVDID